MSNNERLLTFSDCAEYCLSQEEFISQYNRLTGSKIGFAGINLTVLDALIDKACNYTPKPDEQEYFKFFSFVWDTVWMRLQNGSADKGSIESNK